jgi:hypothetical protein
MDKQQAIDYIHLRLDHDAPRDEIIGALIEQLHAPEAMVSKFVAQTEADYRKTKPQPLPTPVPPQPVTLPPWLEEMSIGFQPVEAPAQVDESQADWMQRLAQGSVTLGSSEAAVVEPLPGWALAASQPEAPHTPGTAPASPLWEQEAQVQSLPPQKITNTTEAAKFVTAEYSKGRSKQEISAELAIRTGESQDLTEKFVTITIAKLEKSKAQQKPSFPADKSSAKLDDPALSKYVVNELAKNRKRSDVVMAICERTGVDWSEAQRFVGQINAEQHTTINARKNRLIIPMCIGAIILGFVLTIGTAVPVLYLVTGRTEEFYALIQSSGVSYDNLSAIPWIFGTGIAMIGGGIIGLVLAIQSQME